MRKTSPYISIMLIVIFGCSENVPNSDNNLTDTNKAAYVDTVQEAHKETIEVKNIEKENFITTDFIKLINYVDSCGYICDSNRIKKVSGYHELDNKNIRIIEGKFFYSVNLNDHEIFRIKKIIEKYNQRAKEDTINKIPLKSNTVDYNVFKKVITIYGYFYREDIQSDWIQDGMIEEWKFGNCEDAEKVLIEIKRIGYDLYFNTQPYYLQVDNYFYIFHTRAAAFNLTLKKFYMEFEKIKLLKS